MAVADAAAAGRAAAGEKRWAEARELLEAADAAGMLGAEGLELLAWSRIWTGDSPGALPVLERAYAARVEAGERTHAALDAIELGHEYASVRLQHSIGNGWLQRAEHLLAGEPEGPAHGYLALQQGLMALSRNDFAAAVEHGREAERIGREHGDRGLELRGRQRQGAALVYRGDVEEGKALLDGVSVDMFATELEPAAAIALYCNAIGTCRDVAAFQDAAVLTEKATAFCDEHSLSAFPGMCRVNRAEVKRVAGRLAEAEDEARQARDELLPWAPRIAAAAAYEVGEIRLRLGDLSRAEEAFDAADDLGRDPEPGRSLLLLARGRVQAAFASLRRALGDDALALPERARLLGAFVEVALAAGELERARSAADELAAIAGKFESYPTALRAAALLAQGSVELAAGDADAAVGPLRRALRVWQEAGARYETARTRVLLGEAYRAGGDEEGAMHELAKAGSVFDQLGARLDAERVDELTGRYAGRRVRMAFVFTDIVDSTKKLEALGDVQWQKLLRQHDEAIRAIVAATGGTEVDHTGDGFFLAWERPGDAVAAAVAVQREFDRAIPIELRIGIHADEATQVAQNYRGTAVHLAARIAAHAGAGEILASTSTLAGVEGIRRGAVERAALKGISEPVELVSIDWR